MLPDVISAYRSRRFSRSSSRLRTFEARHIGREREHLYYCIHVRKFTIWYVVIGNVMEVRRFLYNRRDAGKLLPED